MASPSNAAFFTGAHNGIGSSRQYRALLAVAEAILVHRDLHALFRDLADRLQQVVRFDYLVLVLHDQARNTMRRQILTSSDSVPIPYRAALQLDEGPAGWVWQHQRPLIVSNVAMEARWPRFQENVQHRFNSLCDLPLTTARRRLGVLAFGSREIATYDGADVDFLQLVANQVAVAVENALAFDEIAALKDQAEREKVYLHEELRTEQHFGEIVGTSAVLRSVLQEVAKVAPTDASVLIRGETGTGKELIARAVHALSPRRERTLVKLNCAAIPTGLMESELFGHEKGAFTGAITQKIGRLELAHHGTLFLDEVGDIPLELQSKLLRVLQEQEFERLGSTRTVRVDVRVVAATNRDLTQMVRGGRFRSDLYYRLDVFPVVLPALRERREDIPTLVRHFTQRFAQRIGRHIDSIPTDIMDALVRYPWPGNIRELQNVIERAVILSSSPALRISAGDLTSTAAPVEDLDTGPAISLADAEREHIVRALLAAHWVLRGRNGAAARLGMKRSTLQWKMKKLGIVRPK
jgi:formate hydrogenlyase transcriptional activator